LIQDAIESCNKALSVNPKNYRAWRQLGDLKARNNQYDEAIKNYENALKIKPDDHFSWIRKAYSFRKIHLDEEALVSLEKALEVHPNSTHILLEKAAYLERLGRYNEATNVYIQAGELGSMNFWDWRHYAYGMYYSDNFVLAIKGFKSAIELMKDRIDVRCTFVAGCKIYYKSNPSYLALYGLGISFLKRKQYSKSIDNFVKAVLSKDLYLDLWILISEIVKCSLNGKLNLDGKLNFTHLDNRISLYMRHLGIRR
jgi:tetratricopeptide (TPR) repeat protein